MTSLCFEVALSLDKTERERAQHFNEVCVFVTRHEHVWVLGFGFVRARSTRADRELFELLNASCLMYVS